jgi:hypothetical protein
MDLLLPEGGLVLLSGPLVIFLNPCSSHNIPMMPHMHSTLGRMHVQIKAYNERGGGTQAHPECGLLRNPHEGGQAVATILTPQLFEGHSARSFPG